MSIRTRTGLVSLLAIALFVWFLRQANLAEVWAEMRDARVDYLLASFVFVALTYYARAFRWRYLLDPIGPTRFRTAFRTTVIGFAAMFLLPARAGDVLRPYLLARQEGLNPASTLATVVLERVLDLIAVLGLLAIFIWGAGGSSTIPAPLRRSIEISAGLAGAAAVTLLIAMWTLATHPERIETLVLRLGHIIPHGVAARLSALARTFSEGFAAAREPRALVLALAWSFPIWILIAGEAWLVTAAFGIHMPPAGAFLLQSLLVIGVAVPTPGAVGGFHEAYRIGVTTFFGASEDAAVGAALVLHAVSFVPVTLTGILFMAQDGLSVGRLQGLAGTARQEQLPDTPHEMPVLRPSGR
jgi:uncharacterized protein (TIRG00374 family)